MNDYRCACCSMLEQDGCAPDCITRQPSAYGASENCAVCGQPDNCGDCNHG